MSAEITFQR